MTAEQRDVYRNLLDMCWLYGSLPNDIRALKTMSMASEREWKRCWDVVSKMFHEKEGRLYNEKVDEKRPNVVKSKEARAKGAEVVNQRKRALSATLNSDSAQRSPQRSASRSAHAERNASRAGVLRLPSTVRTEHSPELRGLVQRNGDFEPIPPDEFEIESGLRELTAAYPAKGRTHAADVRLEYCQLMAETLPENRAELHAKIIEPIRPGGKWAVSKNWAEGYVGGLKTYLQQRRWDESPEPHHRAKPRPAVCEQCQNTGTVHTLPMPDPQSASDAEIAAWDASEQPCTCQRSEARAR